VNLVVADDAGRRGAAITQDGQRFSPEVDVWILQEPATTPAAEPED